MSKKNGSVGCMLEKIKLFAILFVVLVIAVIVLMIVIIVKKRKRFKAFLAEPLIDHLDDSLCADKFEDWREKRIDVYLYGRIAKYAEQAAFESIPKRKRFDKEGQYTELSQTKISQNMNGLLDLFTKQEGFYFNNDFQYFVREYRPYYTVGDFDKLVVEYLSFVTNPELFEKPVIPPDEPEEDTNADDKEIAEFEAGNIGLTPDEDTVDSEDIEPDPVTEYDPYANVGKSNDVVVHFSNMITVDHMIMNVLQTYTDKLAVKVCERDGIAQTDAYGEKTQAFKDLCRSNYNKLCKLFFTDMKFKSEFVEWVNERHPDMDDTSLFGDLIPMYIRHLKGKE